MLDGSPVYIHYVHSCPLPQASARVTLPSGAYSPSLDKLEQALELIREATVSGGFLLNTDLAVLIDVGADAIYDEVTKTLSLKPL